jgi:DNA-binding response OmpR family regulator
MSCILVVEDEATLNKNICMALENAGFSAISALTAEDALELFPRANLILLDISLPDGSGFDLCRTIRKTTDVPIIFLTSYDGEAEMVRGFDAGCDDYITKPFRLKILISRIKAVIRRCSVELPDIELTAIEQKLLEYLMINRERFLTREQILSYLWDSQGTFVNDNTLSVNISRLRDKLKNSGKGQIITKRGIGYKWTEQTNS